MSNLSSRKLKKAQRRMKIRMNKQNFGDLKESEEIILFSIAFSLIFSGFNFSIDPSGSANAEDHWKKRDVTENGYNFVSEPEAGSCQIFRGLKGIQQALEAASRKYQNQQTLPKEPEIPSNNVSAPMHSEFLPLKTTCGDTDV